MEPTELKAIQEEMGKIHSGLDGWKDLLKKQDDEIKKLGVALPETKSAIEKMNERFNALETKLNRPGGVAGNAYSDADPKTAEKKEREAKARETWEKYCRKGADKLGPEEVKLLTESDNTTGGFLTTPDNVQEIIKGVILISPMRSLARIRNTGKRSVRMPKRTGTFAATWVAEIGTRAETTGLTYGMEEIPNHELYAFSDISNQDLEDSDFDLNAELNMEFSEQLGKAEGTAFVSGSGSGQPEGILTNAAVASDVTGSAAALTYAGFVSVSHNGKSAYSVGSYFIMNRKSIGAARQIVDTQGRPIWMPFAESGASGSNPPTILGSPYMEMPDMPDVAASTYPVAYGNFKRGYLIIDRLAIEVQRDPYTQNTKGVTRFIARKRVGGQVILAEAIRKLQCHT